MNDPSAALAIGDPAAILALQPAAASANRDPDGLGDSRLPADHPQWQRDVVSISSRTRALLATLVPTVVRTLTYWDHRVRELVLGARTLGVDAAGSYRLR